MFCDRCGATAQDDQRFCNHCGREFGVTPGSSHRPGRVEGHVRLLGILWLALSALNALGAAILYILANTLFLHMSQHAGSDPNSSVGTAWLHPFMASLAVIIAVKAAAGFFVGWGLLQREPWARIGALVLGFLALFNVPFGTAVGVYTLWVFLPTESEVEYRRQVEAVRAA